MAAKPDILGLAKQLLTEASRTKAQPVDRASLLYRMYEGSLHSFKDIEPDDAETSEPLDWKMKSSLPSNWNHDDGAEDAAHISVPLTVLDTKRQHLSEDDKKTVLGFTHHFIRMLINSNLKPNTPLIDCDPFEEGWPREGDAKNLELYFSTPERARNIDWDAGIKQIDTIKIGLTRASTYKTVKFGGDDYVYIDPKRDLVDRFVRHLAIRACMDCPEYFISGTGDKVISERGPRSALDATIEQMEQDIRESIELTSHAFSVDPAARTVRLMKEKDLRKILADIGIEMPQLQRGVPPTG